MIEISLQCEQILNFFLQVVNIMVNYNMAFIQLYQQTSRIVISQVTSEQKLISMVLHLFFLTENLCHVFIEMYKFNKAMNSLFCSHAEDEMLTQGLSISYPVHISMCTPRILNSLVALCLTTGPIFPAEAYIKIILCLMQFFILVQRWYTSTLDIHKFTSYIICLDSYWNFATAQIYI